MFLMKRIISIQIENRQNEFLKYLGEFVVEQLLCVAKKWEYIMKIERVNIVGNFTYEKKIEFFLRYSPKYFFFSRDGIATFTQDTKQNTHKALEQAKDRKIQFPF